MCDLCRDNVACQDCGIMVCYDIKGGDDLIRPAYITESGDLFCDRCGPQYDEDDVYVDEPWEEEEWPVLLPPGETTT